MRQRRRKYAARRIAGAAVFAALWCPAWPLVAWAQEAPLKLAVMATYLVKLGSFIEWPAGAFPSPASPLIICVVDGELSRPLDEAAAGQKVGEHPVAVRHVAAATAETPCHILFTGGSAQQSVAAGLNAVKNRPVLTATDQADAAAPKGIINFIIPDNHVRFEIDESQALRAGLRMSSQLLALGVNMKGR